MRDGSEGGDWRRIQYGSVPGFLAHCCEVHHGDSLTGAFQLVNFEAAGAYNNEQTYTLTLESGGSLTLGTA